MNLTEIELIAHENKNKIIPSLSSNVIHFGCHRRTNGNLWDTSYFFSLIFEIFDEFQSSSNDESRLVAFLICRMDDIRLNSLVPIDLILKILNYFKNIRFKILVLVELLNFSETIYWNSVLKILWQFINFGYLTVFYVLDRIKFVMIDKENSWKRLLTIFEPFENKKHAAYILFDKTNFYKPNRASILFGSKKIERYF